MTVTDRKINPEINPGLFARRVHRSALELWRRLAGSMLPLRSPDRNVPNWRFPAAGLHNATAGFNRGKSGSRTPRAVLRDVGNVMIGEGNGAFARVAN
ncbi:MAG TPA: hypothetical protein VGC70_09285 [Burkholderiales bacterium]|jgi:hypothetical protein